MSTDGPVLGRGRLLGHDLVQIYDTGPWVWARCECGEEFRARRESTVTDRWHAHRDEEAENRGLA